MRSAPKTAQLDYERELWARGVCYVMGIDEAGRGAWAGPVAAGAVCLPADRADLLKVLAGVRDSKQCSARQRVTLTEKIKAAAIGWGVGSASAQEIDRLGVVRATCEAMRRAVEAMQSAFPHVNRDYLLIDSIKWHDPAGWGTPYQAIVRGDRLSLSIAAASILAKVWRDQYMTLLHQQYPDYGFAHHKGYGVASHQAALAEHGATPEHRRTFAPIRRLTDSLL